MAVISSLQQYLQEVSCPHENGLILGSPNILEAVLPGRWESFNDMIQAPARL